MNKIRTAALAASVLAAVGVAGAANAADAGGWVSSFDGQTLTIRGEDGPFVLGPALDATNVAPGRTVYIDYSVIGGQRVITGLEVPAHWFEVEDDDDDDDDGEQS